MKAIIYTTEEEKAIKKNTKISEEQIFQRIQEKDERGKEVRIKSKSK